MPEKDGDMVDSHIQKRDSWGLSLDNEREKGVPVLDERGTKRRDA